MGIQLTVDQELELEELARASDRTRDDVAQEAVACLLADQEAHRAKIARAREQIARGETIPHEEVFVCLKQQMDW